MMRQPSTMAQLYAWHRAAMAGRAPAQHDGLPECGWYKRKLVKGCCWVPVRIYVERDICPDTGELTGPEILRGTVDGLLVDDIADQWTYLTPISRADFIALTDAPLRDPRMADPLARIDLSQTPTYPRSHPHA